MSTVSTVGLYHGLRNKTQSLQACLWLCEASTCTAVI